MLPSCMPVCDGQVQPLIRGPIYLQTHSCHCAVKCSSGKKAVGRLLDRCPQTSPAASPQSPPSSCIQHSTTMLQTCGIMLPAAAPAGYIPGSSGTVSSGPTCIAAYQQAVSTYCTQSSDTSGCCPALSALGTNCLIEVEANLYNQLDPTAFTL